MSDKLAHKSDYHIMRVPFSSVFNQNSDGSISPKVTVRVGGVSMGPGVSFGKGVQMGGVDIASHAGKDLEIDKNKDGSITLKGIY